jgi:glutathione S-transferase
MSDKAAVTLFHSPQTRSSCTLTLLEELGAPYELHLVNMRAGENRQAPYLALNPMGKVPAILHNGALITEQAAIFIYLGDLFADADLAPQMGDPLRGPYLRWMAFEAASYEPALVDRAAQRAPAPPAMCTYGDWDTMLGTIVSQLSQGPYLLGERFTAVDVFMGSALNFGRNFGVVPKDEPTIASYVERITSRPAFVRVAEADAVRAAEHQKAAEAA